MSGEFNFRAKEILPLLERTAFAGGNSILFPTWARGAFVIVRVTAITDTPSVAPIFIFTDPVTGKSALDGVTALTATGTFIYHLSTNPPAAAGDVLDVLNIGPALGMRQFNSLWTPADTDPMTYQAGITFHA